MEEEDPDRRSYESNEEERTEGNESNESSESNESNEGEEDESNGRPTWKVIRANVLQEFPLNRNSAQIWEKKPSKKT